MEQMNCGLAIIAIITKQIKQKEQVTFAATQDKTPPTNVYKTRRRILLSLPKFLLNLFVIGIVGERAGSQFPRCVELSKGHSRRNNLSCQGQQL